MTPARPALLALLIGLSGCAHLPHLSHWVKIKPVHTGQAHEVAAEDGYYAGAVSAITRRDYAQALDLLQAARARAPDDVKVLNAFGVVYDKLGRFDLSARYYAQARTLDAGSTILAANVAYSAVLQHRAEAPQIAEPAAAPVTFAAVETPNVIRLGFAAPSAMTQAIPLLTGRTLTIANASGRANGAEPARTQLARLGWSAPRAGVQTEPAKARTTITYAPREAVVAQALARTLPYGIQLVRCDDACAGIRLTLGADALGWRLSTMGD